MVTEYERAVIFRLGRLRKGGSKGNYFYVSLQISVTRFGEIWPLWHTVKTFGHFKGFIQYLGNFLDEDI